MTVSGGEWTACPGEYWVAVTVDGPAVLTGAGATATELGGGRVGRILDVRADFELVGVTLSRGTSTLDGGLVHVRNADFLASGVTFIGGEAQRGGAVAGSYSAPATLRVEDSTLNFGTSALGGGCVYVEGPVDVEITRSEFAGCSANGGDGGSVHGVGAGTLVVEDTSFGLSYAAARGGSIDWEGDAVTIVGSNFIQSFTGGDGGAVAADATTVSISDSAFYDSCFAGGDGGALWLAWTDTAAVERSSFIDSQARVGRGASIAAYGAEGSTLSLLDLTVEDGLANVGGAVYVSTASVTVLGGLYARNDAMNGGAFFVRDSPLAAFGIGARIEDNVATSRGGGVYAVSSNVTVTGDDTALDGFRRNSAEFGGAIDYDPGTGQTLTASTADFGEEADDNEATPGRDVFVRSFAAGFGDGASFVCDNTERCY